jgi:hypothetical protein
MKPIALIFVLLALFAVSDRALTSAEATPTHATASASAQGGAIFSPLSVGCPDICCDQFCSCVRHGFGRPGSCIYQQACTCE